MAKKKIPKTTDGGHLPDWFTKGREKNNGRSRRQERKHAESVGGTTRPGSGSSWRAPEDVRGADFLDQLKFTDSEGFRVTGAELRRIHSHALRDGRTGRLIIDFEKYGLRLTGVIESLPPSR